MFDGVKDMIHLEGLAKRNYSWRYGVNKCKHIEILTSKCILILNGLGRRLHGMDSSSSATSLQTRVPEHSMRPGQAPLPCKPRPRCEKIDFWCLSDSKGHCDIAIWVIQETNIWPTFLLIKAWFSYHRSLLGFKGFKSSNRSEHQNHAPPLACEFHHLRRNLQSSQLESWLWPDDHVESNSMRSDSRHFALGKTYCIEKDAKDDKDSFTLNHLELKFEAPFLSLNRAAARKSVRTATRCAAGVHPFWNFGSWTSQLSIETHAIWCLLSQSQMVGSLNSIESQVRRKKSLKPWRKHETRLNTKDL